MAQSAFSPNERKLLTSFFFFALAWPIFGTFMNTFLWRGSHNPVLLAVFNIGIYVGIPLGFWINAKLLQTIQPKHLFFAGCILQGIAPLLLTTFSPTSFPIIAILGCVLGIALGLYWGNRNLATLHATEGKHRTAFLSMESIQNMLTGVFMPFIIGVGIASAQHNIHLAYVLFVGIGFLLLSIAGFFILRTDKIPTTTVSQKKPKLPRTSSWNALRVFETLNGAITANESIISLFMILTFFGLEDAVGTTKSIMTIITAIMMYMFGKKLQKKHFLIVMTVAAILLIGSTALFALQHTGTSVLIFFGCLALIAGFRTVTEMSIVYATIDHHVHTQNSDRFLLLFDRETFLSVGRIGVLSLFVVWYSAYPQTTLHYGLLGTSLLHIPLIAFTYYLNTSSR